VPVALHVWQGPVSNRCQVEHIVEGARVRLTHCRSRVQDAEDSALATG